MPAYDVFDAAVKQGLIKEGWTISDDLLIIECGTIDYMDMAAERLIAAEQGSETHRGGSERLPWPVVSGRLSYRIGSIPELPACSG